MSSKRGRGAYSSEFKAEAIKLANEKGLQQAADDLGVHHSTIRDWAKKLEKGSINTKEKSTSKTYEELEKENRRLKKELQYMEEINKVLKKSTAIFSSDQLKNSK